MDEFRVRFTDATYRAIEYLATRMQVSMVRVIGDALSLYWWLARERMAGSRLLVQRGTDVKELTIPSLELLMSRPDLTSEAASAEVVLAAPDLLD
jgi:hypothetical protein